VPEGAFSDSVDLSDVLLAKENATLRGPLVTQDNGQAGNFGYRSGNWKLMRLDSQRATNVELRLTQTTLPNLQLFDLDQDPEERENLVDKYPDIVESLSKELDTILGRQR
jgi:arylsulfatase A